jgi:hypothetical protein
MDMDKDNGTEFQSCFSDPRRFATASVRDEKAVALQAPAA